MPLLPYALRPKVIIRRKAIWSGVLGPSTFWKVVAAWVFGKDSLKKFFGKNVEVITTESIGANQFLNIINVKPTSKKMQKATGITKRVLQAQAEADVAAAVAARPVKKKWYRRARAS